MNPFSPSGATTDMVSKFFPEFKHFLVRRRTVSISKPNLHLTSQRLGSEDVGKRETSLNSSGASPSLTSRQDAFFPEYFCASDIQWFHSHRRIHPIDYHDDAVLRYPLRWGLLLCTGWTRAPSRNLIRRHRCLRLPHHHRPLQINDLLLLTVFRNF